MDTLSEYEKRRQQKINQNKKLLASLELPSLPLKRPAAKQKGPSTKRQKIDISPQPTFRMSLRSKGPNEQQPEEEVLIREPVRAPKIGDVSLEASYFKFEVFVTPQSTDKYLTDLQQQIAKSQPKDKKAKKTKKEANTSNSYWPTAPQPRWIDKVVPDRIFSLAVHPMAEKLLVAVGDKWGRLGLWDISVDHIQGYNLNNTSVDNNEDSEEKGDEGDESGEGNKGNDEENKENGEENVQAEDTPKKRKGKKREKEYANEEQYFNERKNIVHVFDPHVKPIYSLQIKSFEPHKIFSSSYDGTVRCLDLENKKCLELYREEDKRHDSLTYLDITCDNSLMYVGNSSGTVVAYDRRAKSTSATSYDIHDRKISHLCCHPSTAHLLATSSLDRTVKIWDCRKLGGKKLEPLSTLTHGQSVTSVDWSQSGTRLLTTSLDDTCRVYTCKKDGKVSDSKNYVSVSHNNHTGRWISAFRARFDPRNEDYFVIGNMNRALELYSAVNGDLLHYVSDENIITAIPSLNVVHPKLDNVIVSANASGRVLVFN